jgi:hypothetical protein
VAKNKLAEITTKMVDLLADLTPEERQRVTQAALTLLGNPPPAESSGEEKGGDKELGAFSGLPLSWIKQNSLSSRELEQVFHVADGSMDVIATEIPGKSNREKTLNAYVLAGISRLLSSGKPNFDDKSARALCQSSGCYDAANHALTLKNKGNLFTGTKDKGWVLTAPGLKFGANLVKTLNKSE